MNCLKKRRNFFFYLKKFFKLIIYSKKSKKIEYEENLYSAGNGIGDSMNSYEFIIIAYDFI